MIQEVVTLVDLSAWAQGSLLMFTAVFVAVAVRTLRQPRTATDRNAAIVLDDQKSPNQ